MSNNRPLSKNKNKTVADFFAGIGLVSMGLQKAGWETIYALDYEQEKEAAYSNNFDGSHYDVKDIALAKGDDVPDVGLAHASFPCTDLSVAGSRKGIHKGESSAFWHFIRILSEMKKKYGEGRPPFILLENVEGLLTSADGEDLRSVLKALNDLHYHVDLLRIDASHFVPQSRVRIFIVGIHDQIIKSLDEKTKHILTQERNLTSSNARPKKINDFISKHRDLNWFFHSLPNLPENRVSLESIIDLEAEWWPEERAAYVRNQMHQRHAILLESLVDDDEYHYFPAFRRMRERDGEKKSTVELRTDGIAGCLRTPKGGSARQILVRAGKGGINVRLINGKEAGHLMGANDFKLNPALSLNQILFGFGDAVCVPAVEWLANNYLNELTA